MRLAGTLGHQAELTCARRGGVSAGLGRPGVVRPGGRGVAGPGRPRAGADGALGIVSSAARPGDPVAGACSSSRAALCDTASHVLAGAGRGDDRDVGRAVLFRPGTVCGAGQFKDTI